MKKIIFFSFVCLFTLFLVSCQKELRIAELQQNFDNQYLGYAKYQLTSAIVNTAIPYGKGVTLEELGQSDWYFVSCYAADNMPTFYLSRTQYWSANDGSNPYTGVFRTCIAMETLAKSEGNNSYIALSYILKCVNLAYLTEKYGDVPFSKAVLGRAGDVFPTYDSQKSIYTQMFAMLDNAVNILNNPSSSAIDATQDVLYKGVKAQWIKFANSLKFRLIMHSYKAFKTAGTDYADTLQAIVAGGNFMQTNADNASLPFVGTYSGDTWYLSTVSYNNSNNFTSYKPTNAIVGKSRALNDPRLFVWCAPAAYPLTAAATASTQTVMINGFNNTVNYSPVGSSPLTTTGADENGNLYTFTYPLDTMWVGPVNVQEINSQFGYKTTVYDNGRLCALSQLFQKPKDSRLSAVLMESSEMQFLLAEARSRNLITVGTASSYYNAGLELSFTRWGITNSGTGALTTNFDGTSSISTDFGAYESQANVALANDGSANDLKLIAFQKWLSNFLTNYSEEFTEIRRSGNPAFAFSIAPAFTTGESYPYRYLYPQDELSNNSTNYNSSLTDLGGNDAGGAKMWIFQ